MSIQSNEGLIPQEFLSRLIQILTPLVRDEEPFLEELANKVFGFVSLARNQEIPFHYSVQLLTTLLHQTKPESRQWSGGDLFPLQKDPEELKNLKFTQSPQKEDTSVVPSVASSSSSKLEERGLQNFTQAPIPARYTDHDQQVIPLQRVLQLPLANAPVQNLITQVREVIQCLTPSDLRSLPFRQVIQKLQLMIDDLIEAVVRGEMHEGGQDAPSSHQATPIDFAKQPLNRKSKIKLPFFEVPRNGKALTSVSHSTPGEDESAQAEKRGGEGERWASARASEEPPSHETVPPPIVQPAMQQERSDCNSSFPLPLKKALSITSEKGTIRTDIVSFDRIALPAAPYLPQNRAIASPRLKKKRKYFWEKEKEEETADFLYP